MTYLISVRNLFWRPTLNYQGDLLKNIDIRLNQGDLVILKGPAASGKTSLLKILALKNKYSAGELKVFDKDIIRISQDDICAIQSKIAYIASEPVFLDAQDVFGNLDYILKLHQTPDELIFNRIMHVLKLTNLVSKRNVSPGVLSHTEKELFGLAMALIREVDIFLCDFNLSGIDEDIEILRILRNVTFRGSGVIATAKESAVFQNLSSINIKNGKIE